MKIDKMSTIHRCSQLIDIKETTAITHNYHIFVDSFVLTLNVFLRINCKEKNVYKIQHLNFIFQLFLEPEFHLQSPLNDQSVNFDGHGIVFPCCTCTIVHVDIWIIKHNPT